MKRYIISSQHGCALRLSRPPWTNFLYYIDPVLIAPYRWLGSGVWGWWLGTLILACQATALSWLTVALGKRLNRKQLEASESQARDMQDKSIHAFRVGEKDAYKAMNRLANEAFGKHFFRLAVTGIGSLWPAFMAAGWLQGYLACYVLVRLAWWRVGRLVKGQSTNIQ